jgi:Flp pilus assembly protein TadG
MQRSIAWIPFCATIARLWRDVSGISLIYVTVALPALMGVCLLAIDVGRLWSLQSSLQHAADSIALAAAGELDGRSDAIARAGNAVSSNMVRNPTIFASSAVTIDDSGVSVSYLRSLPPSDALQIQPENRTENPVEARYVEVTVAPVTFTTLFPATFIGAATNTAQASATAVAGFEAAVCDFTPLFMCNPYEPQNGITDERDARLDYGLYSHVQSIADKRRLMSFKLRDDDGQRQPGDYGFLRTQQNEDIEHLIASVSSKTCFGLSNLSHQRSKTEDARQALNVRFDLYESGGLGRSQYPPSVNVRKGYINTSNPPDQCASRRPPPSPPLDPPNAVMGFPRDGCFASSSCAFGGHLGNGDWGGNDSTPDFVQYWETNFGSEPKSSGPNGQYSDSNLPTRYDIYRDEIDRELWDHQSPGGTIGGVPFPGETGSPQCSLAPAVDEPDRRIIYGAIINCRAVELRDRESESKKHQGVAFGKFFMTEPVSQDGTLWVELIDIVQPGNSTQARDMVQLYR